MPKRIAGLQNYFSIIPESSLDQEFRLILEGFPFGSDESERDLWFRQNSMVIPYLQELKKSYETSLQRWNEAFMNSDEFFQRYPSLPSPFLVFKWSSACFHRNLGFPASESWPFPEILFRDESKAAVQAALDQVEPLKWDRIIVSWAGFRYDDCYLFGKQLWLLTKTDKNVDEDELQLLFLEAVDKDRTRFERLKRKLSGDAGARVVERRESIPEEVRIFVWRRDEGRCVKCGSQERLEFDHIIPVSRGGSNTVRNIQLLCEVCNRKKSNEI